MHKHREAEPDTGTGVVSVELPWAAYLDCLLLQGHQLRPAETLHSPQQFHIPNESVLLHAEKDLRVPAGIGFCQLEDII